MKLYVFFFFFNDKKLVLYVIKILNFKIKSAVNAVTLWVVTGYWFQITKTSSIHNTISL